MTDAFFQELFGSEPHYSDQALLWLGGRTHPAWTDPAEIEANAESRLRLVPAPP